MQSYETAQDRRRALFNSYFSEWERTDSELLEILDHFVFDEVASHGGLDRRTTCMLLLASFIAQQTMSIFEAAVDGALDAGVTPVELKELIYQAVPYCGIAKAADFLQTANAVLQRRGTALPLTGQSSTTAETRFEKGLEVQKSIFGEVIDRLYQQSPENQLHIQRYLSANCFGDYLTRTGLDVKMRELLTFAMLLSLGGCESQLSAHIQGNLQAGNDKETLLAAVTQLLPYIGYPRALNAVRCLNQEIPE